MYDSNGDLSDVSHGESSSDSSVSFVATSHRVFHHLCAPKASTYRAILQIFVSAKERFEIALRASEVVARLAAQPVPLPDFADETDVIACLDSLCEWGNLNATRDVVSSRTLEEYLHPKYLYQLTQAGDMTERALGFFEEGLHRPGELSASALRDIADTLEELIGLLTSSDLDEPKAARALGDLASRFDTLVARAQMFVGGLQRELDRPVAEESAFLALKEELLNYLERFVRELVQATYRISQSLYALDQTGVKPLLSAAVQAELADVLAPTTALRTHALEKWQAR